MKRLISILLAVLMILSVVLVSISASATDFTEVDGYYTNIPCEYDGLAVTDYELNGTYYLKLTIKNNNSYAVSSSSKIYYKTYDENDIIISNTYCFTETLNPGESQYLTIYISNKVKKIEFLDAKAVETETRIDPEFSALKGYTINSLPCEMNGVEVTGLINDDTVGSNCVALIVKNNNSYAISDSSKIYYRLYDENEILIKTGTGWLEPINSGESCYVGIYGSKKSGKIIVTEISTSKTNSFEYPETENTNNIETNILPANIDNISVNDIKVDTNSVFYAFKVSLTNVSDTAISSNSKLYYRTFDENNILIADSYCNLEHVNAGESFYTDIYTDEITKKIVFYKAVLSTADPYTLPETEEVDGYILNKIGDSFSGLTINSEYKDTDSYFYNTIEYIIANNTEKAISSSSKIYYRIYDENNYLIKDTYTYLQAANNGESQYFSIIGGKYASKIAIYKADIVEDTTVDHVHQITTVAAKAPTCTEDGLTEGTVCSICGTKLNPQVAVPALGHTPSDKAIITEPTCTENGVKTYMCTVCGQIAKTEEIPALGHDEIYHEGKAATCTEAGYETYVTCSRCDYSTYTEIPALNHTEETIPAVAATCTTTGLTEGKKCSVCGEILTAQEVIPVIDHTPATAVKENEVAATCTTEGSYDSVVYCTTCMAELSRETKSIDKIAHNYKTIIVEPTCTAEGYTVHTCTVCGNSYTDSTTEKLEHVYTSKITKAATCYSAGLRTYTCLNCNDSYTVSIARLNHTKSAAVREDEVPATCTTAGSYDSVVYCSVCEAELSRETQTIPATGHKSDAGTITKAPTCTSTGTKTYKCTVCNETIKTESVPLLGHTSDEGTITKPATCTSDGEKVYKCTACGEVVNTETIPATAHTVVIDEAVPATCTAEGKTEGSHCSVCNAVITSQTTIPKIAHTSDKGTVTKTATCTAKGTRTYKCTVCDTVIKTSTIKATGHKAVTLKAVSATVKKSGLTAGSKCSVCGTILKAQTMTLAQATGLKASTVKTTSIALKWTAINGAKYYKVEQYNASTKKWITVKTTTATSYTVSKLTAGTTYKFRVTAIDSTKKIAGKVSAILTAYTLCSAPTIKLTSTNSKTATLTITKVTGAKSYTIYKSTDGKKWTSVNTTTKTSYSLTGLTAGKKICVKVVANSADGKASAYSSVKSVTVKK